MSDVVSGPAVLAAVADGLANGWSRASAWQIVAYTLLMTHLTIVSVTVFLHRAQAHRALELGAAPAHFFRFWLWLTTGMVTRQWVAVHRKHHAKCETAEDPHSPLTRGIHTVLWRGAELYRQEACLDQTLAKYGHGTPDDWLERHVYSRHPVAGVALLLVLNVVLFGGWGLTVWAVQMAWIPFWAAGVINGAGHYWGYRNFEAPDASTNLVPWGLLIGGEELHNNHHTYPTSAKFSVKPFEFDLGWGYIRLLQILGWAKVRKVAPQLVLGSVKKVADAKTLEVVITHRYEVMAHYARELRRVCASELAHLKTQAGATGSSSWSDMRLAERWLHRDVDRIPGEVRERLDKVMSDSPALGKLVSMREELRQLWTRTNVSAEQLVVELQDWCHRAESSGVAVLRDFSVRMIRAARA